MGLNRNINDDSTLAYLFNKTRQGASDALQKAIDAINATIATIQTTLNNKVDKSGDTMTGNLTVDRSSGTSEADIMAKGKAGTVYLYSTGSATGNRGIYCENASGTSKAVVTIDQSNNVTLGGRATNVTGTVAIANGGTGATTAANALTNLGAVDKAGDTMTGSLGITRGNAVTSIDLIASADDITIAPSSVVNNNSVFFKDKNGKYYGMVRSRHLTDGKYGLWIAGLKSDGSSGNGFELYFDQEGNRSVAIGYPAGWRSALGLGSIATVASPVPIANGGTGQTEVTSTTTISQVATAASGVSITSVHYAQWGKLAQVNINVKATSAYASGNLLCTLVSGKRPVNTLTIMDNNGYHTTFNTNGQVNVWHAYAVNTTFSVRCVYLLA